MDNRVFTAPGESVSADGAKYHVRRFGEQGPLLVLECGLTMMSACWGWIAPALGAFSRVITYDRAGLGWSAAREELRDARQIAKELRALLGALNITEPIVLLGHSMGAIFNRAYLASNPDRLRAMIWLDPAHPEQIVRRGIRQRMRNLFFYIEAAQLLASHGVPAIEIPLTRHFETLPEIDFRTLRRFLRDPTHLRTCAREVRAWGRSSEQVDKTTLRDLPLLMISAHRNALRGWHGLQQELAALSASTRHLSFPDISHISMLADREHAEKVVQEIRWFLR